MIPVENLNELIGVNGTFMSGVVEGFYGRPWSSEQRKILFRRMEKMGLNTYLYAPKDDCKHRMYWRELYSVEEADHITSLINAASEHNVDFVYAISPGLDITFSSTKDVTLLKKKLEQVASFGCKSFALLFDDIEVDMCESDKEIFQSFAAAQVSVTNEVYQHLSQPNFLFCPTEYCASRAVPNVSTSEYLNTVGTKLLPAINVLWTGPKVISKKISVESIKELASVLKRPPVVWDNIHANDYDRKRLFLGPYDGRSTALIPHLNGVLTNPNCEFEGNFIAMHTLAQWSKASPTASTSMDAMASGSPLQRAEMRLETENECSSESELPCDVDPGYNARQALALAVTDWREEMCIDAQASSRRPVLPASPVIPTPTVPTCSTATGTTSTVVPLTNLNELNNVELNSSYMQPAMSVVPLNSFADSDTDSDESVEQEAVGEPMDCAFTPTSSAASSLANSPDLKSLSELPALPPPVKYDSQAPMQVDQSLSTNTCVMTEEEISFLVECFYLPFEHGCRPLCMLRDFIWLRSNAHIICDALSKRATEEQKAAAEQWHAKALELRGHFNAYWTAVEHFIRIPNQAIVQEMYPYVWDLKNVLSVVQTFLEWMALGHVPYISVCAMNGYPYTWAHPQFREAFTSGDQEPWVFQGGLQAEFQRLLPLERCSDLLLPRVLSPVPTPMFNVRPYKHTDEEAVYNLCRDLCQEGAYQTSLHPDYPDLIPDKLVGPFLTLSSQYCFVIENLAGEVCGYALGALDAKAFYKQMEAAWIPLLKEKYPMPAKTEALTPAEEVMAGFHDHNVLLSETLSSQFPSLTQIGISPCEDPSAVRRASATAFAALHANGSQGVHVNIPTATEDLEAQYQQLGFVSTSPPLVEDGIVTLARHI